MSGLLRVVITGASSGIGEALARAYAGGGATLGLIARRGDALSRVAAGLGTQFVLYPADVRDRDAIRAAAEDFQGRFGGVDAVIANAGVSAGTLTERGEDHAVFKEILDINLIGMFNTFQPFLPGMLRARSGALVGIASLAGYRGLPGAGAYSASKAGVMTYLESLRVELRGRGVKVVTICPGYIATPMTARNPYPMPFLMSAEAAAKRIVRAVERGSRTVIVPWQMRPIGALLNALPGWLYDYAFARLPRKPRRAQ